MQRRYIVSKAADIPGPPILADEPCIVIRAQDILAVAVIDHYLKIYSTLPGNDNQVINELVDHRQRIVTWQKHNPTKIADR